MRSPFKFLDAYTLHDRDVFFGREEEISQLYRMVSQNRLVLVYGQSGTGKTSLIQCGLAARFEAIDWYALSIRRGEDINRSLWQNLHQALGYTLDEEVEEKIARLYEQEIPAYTDVSAGKETSAAETQLNELSQLLVETVEELYTNNLRPVYFIFDQLEELFILSQSRAEKAVFIHFIRAVFEAKLPCRIMFVLREEYIAHLYEFEKTLPPLFDRRLRVELMSYHNVSQVIQHSCERFNIRLENPVANTQQIIDKVSAGKSGIQLPYLQVYLDMLYREDFARTYPELAAAETLPDPLPPLTFTSEEIETFGQIEDVLAKFLKDQEKQLQQKLEEKFENIPENGVRQVLDAFVTEEGTKRPLRYEREEKMIHLEPAMRQRFLQWNEAALSYCLQRLEKARLLRAGEDTLELAHDRLAHLIDQERSDEQRLLNEVKNRIVNARREFLSTGEYLSRKQLISIEEYLPKISLTKELEQFIADSQADAEAREQAELARQQQELEKERLLRADAEKAQGVAVLAQQEAETSAHRARRFSRLAAVVVVVAIFAAGFAVWQNIRTHLATGDHYLQQTYFIDALEEYEAARRLSLFGKKSVNQKIADLDSIQNLVLTYRRYIQVGDSLVEAGPTQYMDAFINYAKAELLEYNFVEPRLKLDNLKNAIDREFELYKEKGRAFLEAGGLEDARYAFEIANKLKPGDEEVERMLQELK